ncbi:O-antigen ligase [Parafrigoribacterium mesophilum]|uniref:O-antigen ligase family protein n=1 Tax=Parafrigoribacterium mesophilum TaxID=433646 RepID=UPI0031FDE762
MPWLDKLNSMIERRGFRIGFAVLVFFTMLAGDAWRYSISWYGWGVIILILAIGTVQLLLQNRRRLRPFPVTLLAFLVLATLSIAWSFYPGLTAAGALSQWLTTAGATALAITLSWAELLRALGIALRIILGLSLLFELTVSLVIRHAVLPFWVDYGDTTHLPKLVYWSRDVLFVDGKIQGIVGNSSLLAMIALLGLIVFGVQLASRSVGRVSGTLWMLLAALIAAITRSATIFVGIAVCAAVVVAVLAVRRARTRRALVATYWTLAALVLAGAAIISVFREQLLALLGKSDTLTGRLGIWDAVIGLAQQRPIFGWGWISYWAPWAAPFKNLVKKAGVQQLHAHNAWLDVWLQLGILGVVVFATLVVVTVSRASRMAVRMPSAHSDALTARTPRAASALTLLPILLLTALIVQSLAESRLIVEYGWLLLTLLAVKTARPDPALPKVMP